MKIKYELLDGELRYIGKSAAQRLVDSGAAVRVSPDRIRKRVKRDDLARWSKKSGGRLGHATLGAFMPREVQI